MIFRWPMALTFCAVLIGGADVDAQERAAEDWIADAMRYQRSGHLEAAWDALVEFHRHPGRNQLDIELFSECFVLPTCPRIGSLGALLGRSQRQAGNLEPFCPDWSDFFAGMLESSDATERAEYEDMMDLVRTRGLGGSCIQWFEREGALLHANPAEQPPLNPQALPIGAMAHENGVWPTVEISIAGNTAWALADSGSSFTWLSSLDSPLVRYLDDATSLTMSSTVREALRVNSVELGSHDLREVVIQLPHEPPHVDVGYVLGMNVFLKYSAVCFHWTDARLHLGETGPCTGGALVDGARLLGNFVIVVAVPLPDGSVIDALLDTGALRTVCSETFVRLNNGVDAFRLGRHPALATECAVTEPGPAVLSGNFQILIGLDTFRRFDAFGWELNPLRVYFVPKDGGD